MIFSGLLRRVAQAFGFGGGGSSRDLLGAEAVRQAMAEARDLQEMTFKAELCEPDVDDTPGDLVGDPYIEVSLRNTPVGDAGSLIFDLEDPRFDALMDVADVTLDELEELEGFEVPVRYSADGNVIVSWEELVDDGEEGSDTEEAEDADSSSVNVQTETVAPVTEGDGGDTE